MLLLAPVLGWLFARGAAGPRAADGVRAALGIALIAVPAGAFLTVAILSWGHGDLGYVLGSTLGVGLFGLILFGIPSFLLAHLIALVWVAIVRVTVRVLRVA